MSALIEKGKSLIILLAFFTISQVPTQLLVGMTLTSSSGLNSWQPWLILVLQLLVLALFCYYGLKKDLFQFDKT